jgi:hypothetical protein
VPGAISNDDLMRSVKSYNRWLDKQGDKAPAVCHATTFLNQNRFQGFLDADLKPLARAAPAPDEPWKEAVRDEIGDAHYSAWIAPLRLSGWEVICPTVFHRDWVQNNFRAAIERAIGGAVMFCAALPAKNQKATGEETR